VRFGSRKEPADTVVSVGAHRRLDPIAIEQIVAARGAGHSYRQIGASLGVSHSTVSRLVASDPLLRARIRSAETREGRRARDRERKRREKARREAGREVGAAPEHEQRSLTAFSPDGEHEPWERVEARFVEAARVTTRPHGRRDELRLARRILLDRNASFDARELALERLLELLEATRSNGRPAYSLRHAAAKAISQNPDYIDEYAPPTRSSGRRRRRR
jgi:hypothetical protein